MNQITIKATPRSMLSESVSAYVEKKINTLSKFLYEENSIRVEMDIDSKQRSGVRYKVGIYVLPQSSIFAEAFGQDIYEAVDLCIPKLKDQLAKKKDKKVALRRKKGYQIKEELENQEL